MKRVVCILCLLAGPLLADTVRLKDGTVLEGAITAETPAAITIEVPTARGTIFKTEVVPRDTIAEVTRLTSEQIRRAALERDLQALQNFGIDPKSSRPAAEYPAILRSHQAFLTKYPGSPYETEVKERLSQWQAESDKVTAGMAKIDGDWYNKEQADRILQQSAVAKLTKAGEAAMSAKKWGEAVRAYDALLALHPGVGTEEVARRQLAIAVPEWKTELTARQHKLETDLAAAQARVESSRQGVRQADVGVKEALGKVGQSIDRKSTRLNSSHRT